MCIRDSETTDEQPGGHADVPGSRREHGTRNVVLGEARARLPDTPSPAGTVVPGGTGCIGRPKRDERADPPGRVQGPSLERDGRCEQPADQAARAVPDIEHRGTTGCRRFGGSRTGLQERPTHAVSYTHLTLPTILRV